MIFQKNCSNLKMSRKAGKFDHGGNVGNALKVEALLSPVCGMVGFWTTAAVMEDQYCLADCCSGCKLVR